MKRSILTLIIVGIAALGFSYSAKAQSFHITKMECIETEGYVMPDAIYFRYRINDGSSKRYPGSSDLSFVSGTERSDFLYVSGRRDDTIHIEVWDHDTFDPDDYIGSFEVRLDWPKENSVYLQQNGGTARYYIRYEVE